MHLSRESVRGFGNHAGESVPNGTKLVMTSFDEQLFVRLSLAYAASMDWSPVDSGNAVGRPKRNP
jgi:hypothetical protein